MKHVIFGDIHGKSLKPLEEVIQSFKEKVNLICLGDFDDTASMLETKDLMEEYGGLAVPGNHDYMLYRKFVNFESGTFCHGKNAYSYAIKLHNDPIALDYIQRLLYGNKEQSPAALLEEQVKLLGIYSDWGIRRNIPNTVIVHGGLYGDLRSMKDADNHEKKMWYRLYDKGVLFDEHAENNFTIMRNLDCNIMIRGHDHVQAYVYKREDGSINISADRKAVFNLLPRRMHIINPGDYFSGYYAIINTDCRMPQLSFHKLR